MHAFSLYIILLNNVSIIAVNIVQLMNSKMQISFIPSGFTSLIENVKLQYYIDMEQYRDCSTSRPWFYIMNLECCNPCIISYLSYYKSIDFYDFNEVLPVFSSQKMVKLSNQVFTSGSPASNGEGSRMPV